ncbi:hypothetical protein [Rhizobium binae]|nr:hypothetical protein [Rhizobium binae]
MTIELRSGLAFAQWAAFAHIAAIGISGPSSSILEMTSTSAKIRN